MTLKSNQELLGNLYAIPGGERFAFGKVIFCSEYFKDVMLIRFFEKAVSSPEAQADGIDALPYRLIFAGVSAIEKGAWHLVGSGPVSDAEMAMSRRIVGGDVWIGDQHLGPASESELATLMNMDVYGYRLIEKAVARLA